MKPLLALALVLFTLTFAGCVSVNVEQPIGAAIPDNEENTIVGDWIGPEEEIWTVTATTNASRYRVSFNEDGKTRELEFTITLLTNKTAILWVKGDDLNAYMPMRLIPGEGAASLLLSDHEEVRKLADAKAIQGTYDDKKKSWLLSTNNLESHLAGKQFWRLDWSMPLVKRKTATNAPASRPAAQE